MNVQVRTDADDVKTCRSRACKPMANMLDKIGNGYHYGCGYFISQPLTRGKIVEQGGRVMTKNKLYAVTGRERPYIFLRALLEEPLTHSWSQSNKNILSYF